MPREREVAGTAGTEVHPVDGDPIVNTGDPIVREVPQEAADAAQQDPDRLIFMTHPETGPGVAQVPFVSFEAFWAKKGWKEATEEDIQAGAENAILQGIK